MALQDYCLKLENFDNGIPAMGTATIEDGVSHSQYVFDPDAKKAFHTAKASMIADAMLVRNLLVQVADSLEQYGRSVSSDEIRSAYEQVKTIDNLDKALDILESETESAVSQISRMLAGQISDGTLSGLSADEVMHIEDIRLTSEHNSNIIDEWVSTCQYMGSMYVNNVHTYCTKEKDEDGYGKTKWGRKGYVIEGIGGYLEGLKVGDDCSSFVFACLYQQGFIKDYRDVNNMPNTEAYLPDKWFGKILSNNGFVWYSSDSVTADDLQQGDIILRRNDKSGHVEIFDHFDENGIEYAYSWGKIYDMEPTIKESTTSSNIFKSYRGFWRYEGE